MPHNIKEQTRKQLEKLLLLFDKNSALDQFLMNNNELKAVYSKLKEQITNIDSPYQLAVAGAVKAGKSTFINTFLKTDLAKVGVSATSATINKFSYAVNPNPEKMIRCVYSIENGKEKSRYVDKQYVDSLQGTDEETIKAGDDIKYVEFLIEEPKLKEISIIDTPGHNANEVHDKRIKEYFTLTNNPPDAAIYLVPGSKANADATLVDYIRDYIQTTAGHSGNVVLIISQSDVINVATESPLERDQELQQIANSLKEQLSIENLSIDVLHVSAELQRFIDRMGNDLEKLFEKTKNVFSELRAEDKELLWRSEHIFQNRITEISADYKQYINDILATPGQKGQIESRTQSKKFAWNVIALSCRIFMQTDDFKKALSKLQAIAGFEAVRKKLDRMFFEQVECMRCDNLLKDAINFAQILYQHYNDYLKWIKSVSDVRHQWLKTIESSNIEQKSDLVKLIQENIPSNNIQIEEIQKIWSELSEFRNSTPLFQFYAIAKTGMIALDKVMATDEASEEILNYAQDLYDLFSNFSNISAELSLDEKNEAYGHWEANAKDIYMSDEERIICKNAADIYNAMRGGTI